jgi:hypothetical protein
MDFLKGWSLSLCWIQWELQYSTRKAISASDDVVAELRYVAAASNTKSICIYTSSGSVTVQKRFLIKPFSTISVPELTRTMEWL